MSQAPIVYARQPLQTYLADVASNRPAPGGGSVSACAGALGAALVSMVCNLTRGREKFADVESDVQDLVLRSEAARATLEKLLQDDTTAYNGVIAAYRMPKETEEQRAARRAAVQAGLVVAASVPVEICRAALDVCRLSRTAALLGNPQAVTDAGIGAVLGEAAIVGAALNVKINLGSIEDAAFVQEAATEIEAIQAQAATLRTEVLEITHSKL